MSQPLLTLHRLVIGYDRQSVLQNVDLVLERGSFTGLLGANGTGKSTLLKTMLGILPPLSGTIQFTPIEGHTPVIGYVPQRETLDPIYLLTSFEVVLMGVCGRVRPGRRFGADDRKWAERCLEQTGVTDLRSAQFSEISGGQKQRVLIARALAAQPDFLVLDEPTAGIDATATKSILDLLARLHSEQKLTILMVNHDLGAVRKAVQNVIWVQRGKLIHGPVAELLTREKIDELMRWDLS